MRYVPTVVAIKIHLHTNKLEIYYASMEMALFSAAGDFENRIKCGHKIITTQVTLFAFLSHKQQAHTHTLK